MARKEQGRVPKRILRGGPARESFDLNGRAYRLDKVLKHDFFAVTGRYVSPEGERICLKHYHTQAWLGCPLDWAGRLMADREVRHYRLLADLPNIPRLLGRVGKSAFAHEWIEGRDLLDFEGKLPDDFFDHLESLIHKIHARGMAYIDMNKPDNVLVGTDGRVALIDFQISWVPRPSRGPLGRLKRRLLRVFQREDLYHVRKLKRQYRRDLMTPEEIEASYKRTRILNLHRLVGAPLRDLRRKFLEWVGVR